MADTSAIQVPDDLAQVAQEKNIPLDLVRRALALGFQADMVKGQLSQPGVTAEAAEAFIAEQERIRAGGEITIPEDLLEVSRANNWPDDLVKRALKLGAPADMIKGQIQAGITPQQAVGFIEMQEARMNGQEVQLDLQWMKVPTEWGIRVKPGKHGLTVGAINVGTYADIPDVWPYQTEMPRGAYPIPGVPSMGYSIYEKAELWSENAADLYEEAIQRRWRPSQDIPWTKLEPLPDDVEKALCQVATALCEKGLVTGDVIGNWLPEMSYGYHEVKLYLSTAEFDCARQFEVFRKRAFSNGGGMAVQSPGYWHRALIDCRAWTETSSVMLLFHNCFIMGLYEIGLATARNEADYKIFSFCQQDNARQIAYASGHLKYFLSRRQERRAEINHYMNKAEADLQLRVVRRTSRCARRSSSSSAAAPARPNRDGSARHEYFWRRWVNPYVEPPRRRRPWRPPGEAAPDPAQVRPAARTSRPRPPRPRRHEEGVRPMTQEATKTKATFPSIEWFNALKEIVTNDEGYKRIGTCDSEVGIKVPDLQKYYKHHVRGLRSRATSAKSERRTPRTPTSGWRCPTPAGRT